MNSANLDQYATLKAKSSLSPEETDVIDAIVALGVAEDVLAKSTKPTPAALKDASDTLEDAQEALQAKPSTTV